MRDTKQEIIHFWFQETEPSQWFQKNEGFDESIRTRFRVTYNMARDGLCDGWKEDAAGCLALCIVLDQFPRNMFRGEPESFATDGQALLVTKYAVSRGFDQILPALQRRFLYLPYEHSEVMEDQKKSVAFFEALKNEDPMGYDYALRHYDVIAQFGRFPHRNIILGRKNTPEEEEYLAKPGAGF
ncbi:MAG: DUF924 domain-containing protein [Alphaproteobacteria bacterium CG_4_9_14_3_um_filter_47_13]|nr:MAG: DUF924 domain-containing protein [Alphaproteobacteria bacterium CG_4_9_14_3_um_filter_47_13]